MRAYTRNSVSQLGSQSSRQDAPDVNALVLAAQLTRESAVACVVSTIKPHTALVSRLPRKPLGILRPKLRCKVMNAKTWEIMLEIAPHV